MKKRALVLGGTRFVGKRLVQLLLKRGVEVTVGSRGRAAIPAGVHHIKVNRFDEQSMRAALSSGEWDVFYDQVCFVPEDAAISIDLLKGRVGRYVLCSTGAVYRNLVRASEEQFDPLTYPIAFAGRSVDYGEGKRQAEAVLFQRGSFSSAAVRFPIILGPDDYTERLRVEVRRVVRGEPLSIVNPDSEISLGASSEAADFLLWLFDNEATGPLNACSIGWITLKEILALIEDATGKKATVQQQPAEPFALFRATVTASISSAKAQQLGFPFLQLRVWLAELVKQEAALAEVS
jgi:nucleoside-diphosphate-sugar epimerase